MHTPHDKQKQTPKQGIKKNKREMEKEEEEEGEKENPPERLAKKCQTRVQREIVGHPYQIALGCEKLPRLSSITYATVSLLFVAIGAKTFPSFMLIICVYIVYIHMDIRKKRT